MSDTTTVVTVAAAFLSTGICVCLWWGRFSYERGFEEGRSQCQIGPKKGHESRVAQEDAPPPKYDQDELKEFIEEGTKAWADVPDAAAWVRELRGGKP
jgi:hypothetical protein